VEVMCMAAGGAVRPGVALQVGEGERARPAW